jgi:hypothetical protein
MQQPAVYTICSTFAGESGAVASVTMLASLALVRRR